MGPASPLPSTSLVLCMASGGISRDRPSSLPSPAPPSPAPADQRKRPLRRVHWRCQPGSPLLAPRPAQRLPHAAGAGPPGRAPVPSRTLLLLFLSSFLSQTCPFEPKPGEEETSFFLSSPFPGNRHHLRPSARRSAGRPPSTPACPRPGRPLPPGPRAPGPSRVRPAWPALSVCPPVRLPPSLAGTARCSRCAGVGLPWTRHQPTVHRNTARPSILPATPPAVMSTRGKAF